MQFVYGPVPSRRLGSSLGVDVIPFKTCNWNCVYCQLGRTQPLTAERREYVSNAAVMEEIRAALAEHPAGSIDWITFAGSGEPTLHTGLGELVQAINTLHQAPVAVITNGSLLYLDEVQAALLPAAAVLPSLDAGTAELFKQIDRPHGEATFERLIEGMLSFRQRYTGQLWLEVMLVRGLNDTEAALTDLARQVARLQPDKIHLLLPNRAPAETWVLPSDEAGLQRAKTILGQHAEIVAPTQAYFDLGGHTDLLDAILDVIGRHPMSEQELINTLHHWASQWAAGDIAKALVDLANSGRAQVVERYDQHFWSSSPARYPDEHHSQATAPEAIQRHRGG